jgi:tetratricopeptide (TPR) repeat protein
MGKKSTANVLFDVIMDQGLEVGLKKLNELKSDEYILKEDEMNKVGYQLLNAGKNKEAIAVFKINVEAFPKSGNVYDSLGEAYLGEAYLKDGDKKLTILNYKKSVQLDPKNANGKKVLEEISK